MSDYEKYAKHKKESFYFYVTIWAFLLFLIIWSWFMTGFGVFNLILGIKNTFLFILFDLLPPNFLKTGIFIKPALETIYMSFSGVVISVFFSLIISFLTASTTSFHPGLSTFLRLLISFIRSVPALIWGIFMVTIFGLGPFAGTVALGISGIGILGKAYADILENIDKGQIEAVRAVGANWFQVIGRAVWPQFKPGFIAWSLYKIDINIREASIMGMIGAGGIGYILQYNIKLFRYKDACVAIIIILFLILLSEFITTRIRNKII
jgi:phosphonate transport system permease protein